MDTRPDNVKPTSPNDKDEWLKACGMGQVEQVKSMLDEKRVDLYEGLSKACGGNHVTVIRLLLDHGVEECTPGLAVACEAGHQEAAQLMLDHNADIEAGLDYACRGGQTAMVHFLLDKGAHHFDRGLVGACLGHHMELVHLMISKGATDFYKGLWIACQQGFMDLVELMLGKGAHFFDEPFTVACKHGHLPEAKLMLAKGATCTSRHFKDACEEGHANIVQLTLDKLLQLPGFNSHLFEGFHNACRHGHVEIVQLLMDTNPVLSARPKIIQQGLVEACVSGNQVVYQLMLDKGAKLDLCAFKAACGNGHQHLVQLILDDDKDIRGGNNATIDSGANEAAINGHMDLVRFLVLKGARIVDMRAYKTVCNSGRADILHLLLDRMRTYDHWTDGLIGACEQGHVDTVSLLLGQELPRDYDYDALLTAACCGSSIPIVQLVLAKAGPGLELLQNQSTLSLVLEIGHLNMVQFLVQWKKDHGLLVHVGVRFGAINSVLVFLCREWLVEQSIPPIGNVTLERSLCLVQQGVYPSLIKSFRLQVSITALVVNAMSCTDLQCVPRVIHCLIYEYL